jgi:signal transduction histidine kinase
LLVAVVAVAGSLHYAQRQVDRLKDQTSRFTRSYAELIGIVATDTSTTSSGLDYAISEMIGGYDFPYVVTDTSGTPHAWRGLGVEGDQRDPEVARRIERSVEVFDRQFDPIPISNPEAPLLFHYGDPPEVRRLRVLPYIQLGLMALVLALVWWSLRAGLERQRSLVWVGLARESAHQFGTPLSSLRGWLDLLADRMQGRTNSAGLMESSGHPDEESLSLLEIADGMGEDVERLSRITNRFAKLGSPPAEEEIDLEELCRRVVAYMRKRAPQRGVAAVEIVEEYEGTPAVLGQEELLEWVIENLLKNAIDAVGGKAGRIEVRLDTSRDRRWVNLHVKDDGAGIPPADQRYVFDPGFSRKRRGWGLGLALSRRLVEAHGGRLSLAWSRPEEGSAFEAALPVTGQEQR